MAGQYVVLRLALVLIVATLFEQSWATQYNCKPTVNGIQYDFTSLAAQNGSYLASGAINGTNYIFQIQICGDVSPQPYSACSVASPINQLTTNKSICYALADSAVYAWDNTPFNNGIMLSLYHGTWLNHITARNSILYFICGKDSPVVFEHERIALDTDDNLYVGAQFHFTLSSPLACANHTQRVMFANN